MIIHGRVRRAGAGGQTKDTMPAQKGLLRLRIGAKSNRLRFGGALMRAAQAEPLKVLVIDVGGTHIKLLVTGQKERRKIASGPTMTASKMVGLVKKVVKDWQFDCVSR